MSFRRVFCVLLAAGLAASAAAQRPALIPAPQSVAWEAGAVDCARYQIIAPAEAAFAAGECRQALSAGSEMPGGLPIRFSKGTINAPSAEAYTLDVSTNGIRLTASQPVGWLYGVETLRQLLAGTTTVPACHITDWPAFPWRGFMHDVGRNFQDLPLLENFTEVMAHYKMNVFHFHLTDNPGWRIECRVHPELNDPKNYLSTRAPGKFYTYAELNRFIAGCARRGITVVPEIDMPGHSDYFQRAFGVDMQSERGMQILADCVGEFLDQVPTEYFHMGADEVHLKNPAFMDRMADLIRSHGRQLLAWRPGHLPGGKVITQLWSAGGAQNGTLPDCPAVDSRNNYLNAMDPFDGPLRLLNLATDGKSSGDNLALGGTLCCWPDINAGADPMNIYRQSPVFPALLAAAENYWHGGMASRPENWTRLPADTNDPAFVQFADFEARMMANRDLFFRDWPFPYVKQTDLAWKIIGPFPLTNTPAVERDLRDSYDVDGKTFRWLDARGATLFVNHFWYGASALPAAKEGVAYALTHVWSPQNQTVDFWIGFNDPIRSSRRGVPNPAPGQWSNVGSRIWVNQQAIPPPHWQHPGRVASESETPFTDESYFFRPPTAIALKSGWNQILIKAPKTREAFKWSLTCVPVSVEGNRVREVKGLHFATAPATN